MKRTFLTFVIFSLWIGFAAPALAQSNDMGQLDSRINQLENQLQTLSRAVFRGDTRGLENFQAAPPAAAADAGSRAMITTLETRINGLEQEIRTLTRQLEEQQFATSQMQRQLESNATAMQQQSAVTPAPQAPLGANNSAIAYSSDDAPVQAGTTTLAPADQAGQIQSQASGMSPDELYERAFVDIRDGNYPAAERGFSEFLNLHPEHQLAANAQYWLAESYYVRGDYTEAARLFARGYQEYPDGSKGADNLLKLGLSLARLGNTDDACLSLAQLKEQFPDERGPVMRRADQEITRLDCDI